MARIGESLLRKLFAEIIRYPPHEVIKKIKCIILTMLKVLKEECTIWVIQSVAVISPEILTMDDKDMLALIVKDGSEEEATKMIDKIVLRSKKLLAKRNLKS